MTTPSVTATTAVAVPVPSPHQSYGLHLAADLRSAESELQRLRGKLRQAAAFIHDSAHDLAARQALALRLGLPEPSRGPASTAPGAGATQPGRVGDRGVSGAASRARHVPEG